MVSEAAELLRALADDTRVKFDDLSEKAQEGERGQKLSGLADNLEAAADELENAQSSIQACLEVA
jgi:hypothetical protein